MMKYKFKFAIGDWSNDGHGQCEYFVVKSNKPVEEVRESHYQIENVTGINIDKICKNYEDDIINNENYELLVKLGFDFELQGFSIDGYDDNIIAYCNPLSYVLLWIFLLKQVDKTLELEIVSDDIPMFQFYGYDEQGRHIKASGYGLFII